MFEELFINALEISLTSGAAALLIILVSKLSESRFRAKWRYFVWLILALRLVLPFNFDLPKAPIKMEMPRYEMVFTKTEPAAEKTQSGEAFVPAPSRENPDTNGTTPVKPAPAPPENTAAAPESYKLSLLSALTAVWLFGAALAAGKSFFAYFKFKSRAKPWNSEPSANAKETFASLKAEMGVSKNIALYENRLVKSPMMVGFLRPTVLLPAAEFSSAEYAFILRHELTHFKRGDLWYKLVLTLAGALNWYNPAVGVMRRFAESDVEITCDEAVVEAMDGDGRREYCETILHTMRKGQNAPLALSTGFYGGAKTLKKRFSAVLEPRAQRGVLLFILAAAVIAVSGTLVACSAEKLPPENGGENSAALPEDENNEQQEAPDTEEDAPPAVTGPDENGRFPIISDENWEKWVKDGEPDTEVPTEPVSPILECEDYLNYLKETYPEIDDWEVVYETSGYQLVNTYDPYTYSFREKYMPWRFALLKTEESKDFDCLFVNTYESYAAVNVQGGIEPRLEFSSFGFTAFEKDVEVGSMEGAEVYDTQWAVSKGLWFPEENKAIIFDLIWYRAFAAYGVTKPLSVDYVMEVNEIHDINNKKIKDIPKERQNDLFVYINDENGGGRSLAYYDGDARTITPFDIERGDNGYEYPQTYYLDADTMVVTYGGDLKFYDMSEGKDITASFAAIGGNGNGLSENKIATPTSIISEDKTNSGRYAFMYYDENGDEDFICTFDREGNILSNFGTGLHKDGNIGSMNFRGGIVYFSYYPAPYSIENSVRYAVDARPGKEHILQKDAW